MPLIKDLCIMCFAKANKAAMTKRERSTEIRRTLAGERINGQYFPKNENMLLPGRRRMGFYALRKRYD